MATQTNWTTSATGAAWRGLANAEAAPDMTVVARPKAKADPCLPPCPECGGLECYCRPRFFAGQLLTERELNGLQDYVAAKHRLHNRYLVGAGIVCGLEATCDPCGDMVRIAPGYAISPCGEDIVVCRPDSVDICALIAKCRETAEPDCRPYAPRQDGCAEIIEDWVLTIRYAEAPARDAPAKTADCQCGSGGKCGCSGHGGRSGGCGCGGECGCSSGPAKAVTQVRNSAEPVLRRGAPPACVPQYTCESYRYDVFRAPDLKPQDRERDPDHPFSGQLDGLEGPMIDPLRCCIREIEDAMPPLTDGDAGDPAYRQAVARWLCDTRDNLKRHLLRRGGHDCAMMDRLMAVPIPPTNDSGAFVKAATAAFLEVLEIAFELMIECLCSALLPACPAGEDPRIPIAVVKVRRGSCEIVSVCNWTPLRRQLVTWPALNYWLGWAPQLRNLREYLHLMCCEKFGIFDKKTTIKTSAMDTPVAGAAAEAAPAAEEMAAGGTEEAAMAKLAATETLIAKSIDAVMARRAGGLPIYEAGPIGVPASVLLAAVAGPRGAKAAPQRALAVDRLLGELMRPLREAMPVEFLAAPFGVTMPGTTDLAFELAALRKTVAEQQSRIAALEGATPTPAAEAKTHAGSTTGVTEPAAYRAASPEAETSAAETTSARRRKDGGKRTGIGAPRPRRPK